MSVLQRSDLEASPLADLHELASTLKIDGFRRLRKADLIDRILARQSGDEPEAAEPGEGEDAAAETPVPRRSRWRRSQKPDEDEHAERVGEPAEPVADEAAAPEPAAAIDAGEREDEPDADAAPARAPRSRRGGRGRGAGRGDGGSAREDDDDAPRGRSGAAGGRSTAAAPREGAERGDDPVVEGVIELLPNGSGFVRLTAGETSDDDVYISAAQVRRCELVAGDRVRGPVRPARRSERYPSLIKVEEINGESADAVAEGTRFEDLDATFPNQPLPLAERDETLAEVVRLAPLGRGSRAVIAGPSRSGKTELLRRIAAALAAQEGLSLEVVLVGVRPEELSEWKDSELSAAPPLSFAASAEAQAHAIDQAVERGRRIAARGGDAVLLIDTLDGLHPPAARRALASARNLSERGSLTIVATATRPVGGENAVIALDLARAGTGRLPAIDPLLTGSIRADLLVGADGATAVVKARAEALGA